MTRRAPQVDAARPAPAAAAGSCARPRATAPARAGGAPAASPATSSARSPCGGAAPRRCSRSSSRAPIVDVLLAIHLRLVEAERARPGLGAFGRHRQRAAASRHLTPAEARGSGGAQKMSKAASKVVDVLLAAHEHRAEGVAEVDLAAQLDVVQRARRVGQPARPGLHARRRAAAARRPPSRGSRSAARPLRHLSPSRPGPAPVSRTARGPPGT